MRWRHSEPEQADKDEAQSAEHESERRRVKRKFLSSSFSQSQPHQSTTHCHSLHLAHVHTARTLSCLVYAPPSDARISVTTRHAPSHIRSYVRWSRASWDPLGTPLPRLSFVNCNLDCNQRNRDSRCNHPGCAGAPRRHAPDSVVSRLPVPSITAARLS